MNLLRSLSALVATTVMAAEVPVSRPVYAPAPQNQYTAAAASNGDQYLVVWADERTYGRDAYATRISADGAVLDRDGIRVASGALGYYPSVIWSGSSYFVLSNVDSRIELVRVAPDGRVLDAVPRTFTVNAWYPGLSVATDGRYVAMGYYRGHSTYEERALILDGDGTFVADVLLSAGEHTGVVPAIASDGASFVAVWEGRAVRFDHSGLLGPVREVDLSGAFGTGHIAWNGTELLVTRGSLVFRMSADLVAERIGVLPFATVQSVHWTGSAWAVTGVLPFYQNGNEHRNRINLVLLGPDGRLLGQREMQSAAGSGAHPLNGAAVASNGRNLLVAWHDPTEAEGAPSWDDDTYAAVVSLPDLTPEPRRLLSIAARAQHRPVTAAGPANQLTVWEEASGFYARRHWRNGATDPAPLRLTNGARAAAVAFNGVDYIVATAEGTGIVTRRVPASGELRVDGEGSLQDVYEPEFIAIASDGETTLVAWHSYGVHAARVGADGSLIDTVPLEVASGPLAHATHRIAISPNGDNRFLVVWGGSTRECNHCSPYMPPEAAVVRAARVTQGLTLLDPTPIEIAFPEEGLVADHPSATWNGNEWLVVWNRAFRGGEGEVRDEVRGRRIARNGTLRDPEPGLLIARDAYAPTVAWTGFAYLLGWYEGSPSYRSNRAQRSPQRIRTATFDRPGGPLSNQRTLGETPDADPVSFAVFAGFASVAYARSDSRYGGVSRAFLDLPGGDSRRRAVGIR